MVGTTAAFVAHLSPSLQEGRPFAAHEEAVVGALSPLRLGDEAEPAHGHGEGAEAGAHGGHRYAVVGRMRPAGSPWDRAILVPVESVWEVHGLAAGHAPERAEQLGPPFDVAYLPGAPALLVRPRDVAGAYALRDRYARADAMATVPGAVLSQLFALLRDVREAMSLMALARLPALLASRRPVLDDLRA